MLIAFVVIYNSAAWWALCKLTPPAHQSLGYLQTVITWLDQLTLTLLLGLLGGLDALVLPRILPAMFMVAINTTQRQTYAFAASMLLMTGILFILQHHGWVPYQRVVQEPMLWSSLHRNPFVASWSLLLFSWFTLAALLFAVVFFNFVKEKFVRILGEIIEGRQEITNLRQLSHDILDLFPMAVVTADTASGCIDAYNPAAARLLGAYSAWLGQQPQHVPELTETGLAFFLERACAGEEIRVNDFRLLRR